jgi:hypothetical protein
MADEKDPRELELDLRADTETIRAFIRAAASHYPQQAPGEAVRGLEVFYSLLSGFVQVGFWANPDYQPFYSDRTQRYRERFDLPHWKAFYQGWFKAPAEVIFPEGSILQTRPGHSPTLKAATAEGGLGVVKALGMGIARLLTSMHEGGSFGDLPEAESFTWGVTDQSEFWWSSDGANKGT